MNDLHNKLLALISIATLFGGGLAQTALADDAARATKTQTMAMLSDTGDTAAANHVKDIENAEASLSMPPDSPDTDDSASLWPNLREGFVLEIPDRPEVARQIEWYSGHPKYLSRTFTRGRRYLYYVVQQLQARNMPAEIALLPVVESAYHPFAYSNGRAAGLWQFIPATGRHYGLKQNWWYDGRRDPIASTRAALDYLSSLHDTFGDWLLALAAYNSGAGTVQRAIRRNKRHGEPTDFWHLALPKETRDYVPKLLAVSAIVADPDAYSLSLPKVPNAPQFAVVDTGGQIDLALAADLADIDLQELYWLNPGCNRWSTAPDGPNRLLVPAAKAEDFEGKLAELPAAKRLHWERHKIRPGEALQTIAKRYHTTVAAIRDVNGLHENRIRVGHYLVVPVAARSLDAYALSATERLRTRQNAAPAGRSRNQVVVRSGDSLWKLARRHDVGVNALAKWNGMAPGDPLRAGQKLVVWTGGGKTGSRVAGGPPARMRTVHYTVRRGDSVAAISRRFRVKVTDVLRWNGIGRHHYLHPGQGLTLYVDVTRQSGV